LYKEVLNKLIPFMVRQAHHERNQPLAVRPEPVEGFIQRFHRGFPHAKSILPLQAEQHAPALRQAQSERLILNLTALPRPVRLIKQFHFIYVQSFASRRPL